MRLSVPHPARLCDLEFFARHRSPDIAITPLEKRMKALRTVLITACLSAGFFTTGCETSHTESDSTGLLGGHKHEETTTTKNPITGDTSTTHTEQKTR